MAATAHTTRPSAAAIHLKDRFTGAGGFKVNGWQPLYAPDSEDLFLQAHALVSMITSAGGDGEIGAINPMITQTALRGIETLLSLGLLVQHNEGGIRIEGSGH